MLQNLLIHQIGLTVQRWLIHHKMAGVPLLACVIGLAAMVFFATPARAHEEPPFDTPEWSLAAEGLVRDEALCGSSYRIVGTDLCTHGPDVAPPDLEASHNVAALDEPVHSRAFICDGDGSSGKRVQLMYVREEDVPDGYDKYVDSIRTWAREMDEIFEASARETGGHRRIRFVTGADCQLSVLNVVVPAVEQDTFNTMIGALVKLGYNSPDRKYVTFVDATTYCGIGTIARDSSPGPENRSNQRAGYARIDRLCWSGRVAAHELVHNLGGVQNDAPHASGGWHCVDEYDIMCYSDTPLHPTMQFLCPASQEIILDCNHDDYYHTNPPADSYLATHWNVANSAFLMVRDELTNIPPTVSLVALASSAIFTAPTPVAFTAQVSDTDGIVTRVEFYNGATLLETDTTYPYDFTWDEVASGVYTVTATVYDDVEASATSNPLIIVVAKPTLQSIDQQKDHEQAITSQVYLPLVVKTSD